MKGRRLLLWMSGLAMVLLSLAACGMPQSTPTPVGAVATRTRAPAAPMPTQADLSSATPPSVTASTPMSRGPYNVAGLGSVDQDVTYCSVGEIALKMDVYTPTTMTIPAPAVVFVHGGGWIGGDKTSGAMWEVPELLARGYVVFAVNYRLAPEHPFPAQIEDVKCAIRHIRANAGVYHIDPDRIGAFGGSAGGHLVSLLGVTDVSAGFEGGGGYVDQSSRVQAVVDKYGHADLAQHFLPSSSQAVTVFSATDSPTEALVRASPITYISGDDSPFLILHGVNDTVVPPSQSMMLYQRLAAAGVPVVLVMVENAGHGFKPVGGMMSPSRPELTEIFADFFDEHLR